MKAGRKSDRRDVERKRFLIALIVLALVLALAPAAPVAAQSDDGPVLLPLIEAGNASEQESASGEEDGTGLQPIPSDELNTLSEAESEDDSEPADPPPGDEPEPEAPVDVVGEEGDFEPPTEFPEEEVADAEPDESDIAEAEAIQLSPASEDEAAVYDVVGDWRVTGRLGLGTDTPVNKAHIVANTNWPNGVLVRNENLGNAATTQVKLETPGASQGLELQKFGPNNAWAWNGIPLANWARIRTEANVSGLIITTGGATPLIFGTNNTGRIRLTSGGRMGFGTATPGYKLDLHAFSESAFNAQTTNGVYAMRAYNSAAAGTRYGIYSEIESTSGYAGFFRADAETGSTRGIYVDNDSTSGIAGYFLADASTGTTYGVFADNDSTSGRAGYFRADASTGTTYGLYVDNNSSSGRAVYALADSSTGTTTGLYAEADSDNGRAVYAIADNASGDNEGVIGISNSPDGEGVEAINNSTSATANIFLACSSGISGCGAIQFRVRRDGTMAANGSLTGGGADYADMMAVADGASNYEPGDVLVLADNAQLTMSDEPNSTTVIGVYSTDPAVIGDPLGIWEQEGMTRMDRKMVETLAKDRVPVAMAGMVPVKVTAENGLIRPGDLLTTSSTPGHAMRAEPVRIDGVEIYQAGTIIGKAITGLETDEGVIEMLVMMQ